MSNLTPEEVFGEETELLKMVALTGDYKLSAEDAQEIAIQTATDMRNQLGIVTKSQLQIAKCEKIRGDAKTQIIDTKTDTEPDSLVDMYLFNFANDEGYVLMSGDQRAGGVLAYHAEGNLGDTLKNPGQIILIERSMDFINAQRKKFEEMEEQLLIAAEEDLFQRLPESTQDSLIMLGFFDEEGKRLLSKALTDPCDQGNVKSVIKPINPNAPCNEDKQCIPYTRRSYGSWVTTKRNGPLLKTLWSQGYGYNKFVPLNCPQNLSGKAPVGCVAVAVGQIMAYHQKPRIFNGREMNWNKMVEINSGEMFSDYYSVSNYDAQDDISYLLKHLGDGTSSKLPLQYGNLLIMDYSCDVSLTSSKRVPTLFNYLGYHASSIMDYDNNNIEPEIINGRPIYIDGCPKKISHHVPFFGWWLYDTFEDCHAWVIDGYIKQEQKVTHTTIHPCSSQYNSSITTTNTLKLVHNNFGWQGYTSGKIKGYSGWYRMGLFDSNNKADQPSNYKSDEDQNYRYRLRTIIHIN